ncbi:hypothetical protein HYR99_38035 [Candidatus Poribacteria bacterium]|nr:hypothetical protein [Candidatus Poribacteria bacterium]
MKRLIIRAETSYTFADYFQSNFDVEDILSHFGYSFQAKNCVLPSATLKQDRLRELKSRLEESLPYLSLTSEVARREFLIAPVLLEVVHYTHAQIKVEFPLEVNEQLKGTLDYYLQAKNNLLIIEAKNADLQKGFTQLAVELVALDQWLESSLESLYGAVSIGNIWQFGILDRPAKGVTQDLNLYRVPADLEDLLKILVAILCE